MSIVGPRPLLVEYLPYYTEEEHHRHDLRPRLTGLRMRRHMRCGMRTGYGRKRWKGRLTWKEGNGGGRYGSGAEKETCSGVFLYPD